jgi:hypothetical protein
MPPQMLANVKPPIVGFAWGPVIHERPALAALVMQVIGLWSAIDATINGLLADFLKLDILVATKMLQAVENMSTRRVIIRTAAQHVLPVSDFDLFTATLKTTRASETRRHAFAHHVWGIPTLPVETYANTLLLIDPKLMNRSKSEIKGAKAIKTLIDPSHPVTGHNWIKEIYLFTERDLHEDVQAADRAYKVISWLQAITPGADREARDSIRAELLKEPLIRQEIDNQSAKKSEESH